MKTIELKPGEVSLDVLRRVYLSQEPISLDDAVWPAIEACEQTVRKVIAKDKAAYGINTGFGLLANTRIPNEQLAELQKNLVLSHAAGIGKDMTLATVRLMMSLKIISLSRGYSGVRPVVVQTILDCINKGVMPCVPEKGSVGASGDLAPLAHMALTLIGDGMAYYQGEKINSQEALNKAGIEAVVLGPKEGLALLNGTQASTALALIGLFKAENVFAAATVAGALSVDALKGSASPFDARIHEVRGQPGQITSASLYRRLLDGSEILHSHNNDDCKKVQDPYSLRCQPQIMGACLDQIHHASQVLAREANAATDNPLIFANGDVISGGNFHAEPVAIVADNLAIAIAEIAAVSERRLAILVDPKMSELPAFLVKDSGLNSGFMIAQVTAAALASENKTFAHPASVDSLPTSANQEDHVSMATFGARRLGDMAANSAGVIGIELLAAAQGIDFHEPLKTSPALQTMHAIIRSKVSHFQKDRYIAPDIEIAAELVLEGEFYDMVADVLPSGLSK